jgi:hypothetical protein
MSLIIRLLILVNRLVFWDAWEFRAIRRDGKVPPGWDLAHHEIKGRNGGLLLVPRERGTVWPRFIGLRFRLAVRPRRKR